MMKRAAKQSQAAHSLSPLAPAAANLDDSCAEQFVRGYERLVLGSLTAAAFAYYLFFRLRSGVQLEDALITWRYAENIATGNGFVFNPGERVQGTTTPLQTLMLAFLGVLFGSASIPWLAFLVMSGVGLAGGIINYLTLRRLAVPPTYALPATAIQLFNADVVWSSVGGMETPLVLFLMALSLHGLACAKYRLCGVAAALLVLTRVDGLIWAGLMGLAMMLVDRRKALHAAALGLLVILPWFVFALVYFGTPIPNSVYAKSVIHVGEPTRDVASFFFWATQYLGVDMHETLTGKMAVGVWLLCLALGTSRLLDRPSRAVAWPLLIFPIVFLLAFWIGYGTAPMFPWYLVPVAWVAAAVGGLGLPILVRTLAEHPHGRVLAIIPVLLIGADYANANRHALSSHQAWQKFEGDYRRTVGEWIDDHAPKDAVVAMEAIGYQGTYAKRRLIDLAGLISPEVVRLRQESQTNAELFGKILTRFRPDYVVLRRTEVAGNRSFYGGKLFDTDAAAADFRSNYTEVTGVLGAEADSEIRDLVPTIYALTPPRTAVANRKN